MYATLRNKSNDWLAQNYDMCLKWSDLSTCGLLFHYKNSTKLVDDVQSGHLHNHLVKINLFHHEIAEKIAHLAFNNNHSPTLKIKGR